MHRPVGRRRGQDDRRQNAAHPGRYPRPADAGDHPCGRHPGKRWRRAADGLALFVPTASCQSPAPTTATRAPDARMGCAPPAGRSKPEIVERSDRRRSVMLPRRVRESVRNCRAHHRLAQTLPTIGEGSGSPAQQSAAWAYPGVDLRRHRRPQEGHALRRPGAAVLRATRQGGELPDHRNPLTDQHSAGAGQLPDGDAAEACAGTRGLAEPIRPIPEAGWLRAQVLGALGGILQRADRARISVREIDERPRSVPGAFALHTKLDAGRRTKRRFIHVAWDIGPKPASI